MKPYYGSQGVSIYQKSGSVDFDFTGPPYRRSEAIGRDSQAQQGRVTPMSSTEATLAVHEERLDAQGKRQDRVESILIAVAGAVILQLAVAVATLLMMLLKGK